MYIDILFKLLYINKISIFQQHDGLKFISDILLLFILT